MIQITPQMRILLCLQPADFRKGIDGLAALCRQWLGSDPFSGTMFVFKNRSSTALKFLCYDGQGYWMMQKRLSQGRFYWWPASAGEGLAARELAAHELQLLIWNGNPDRARTAPLWRRVQG